MQVRLLKSLPRRHSAALLHQQGLLLYCRQGVLSATRRWYARTRLPFYPGKEQAVKYLRIILRHPFPVECLVPNDQVRFSFDEMRLLLVVLLSCTAQVRALVVHNRVYPWMKAESRGMLQGATSTIIPQRSRLNSVIERGGNDSGSSASSADTSRRITWSAAVKSSVWVREDAERRTVKEYMALPATQYSVLSASQIERLSDTEFKATLGSMNFFGTKIIPVLYVNVNVVPEEHRAEIVVERAETVGSEIAEKLSGTFTISAINLVSAGRDDKDRATLTSETKLLINVVVPEDAKVPRRLIQSGGNFIIQSSLNIIVPTFVRILAEDFKR